MDIAAPHWLRAAYLRHQSELSAYVTRMVLRPEIAEELVQQCVVNLIQAQSRPVGEVAERALLFTVASNLAIDYLRRHGTWRETVMDETRLRAEADADYMRNSMQMVGSPKTANIVREHIVMCLACTMRTLPPDHAAGLNLIEVHGFTIEEAATMCSVSFAQMKNWVQQARATLRALYGTRCALINKQGMCHQCDGLSAFFHPGAPFPIDPATLDIDARFALARAARETPISPWHTMMLQVTAELLAE